MVVLLCSRLMLAELLHNRCASEVCYVGVLLCRICWCPKIHCCFIGSKCHCKSNVIFSWSMIFKLCTSACVCVCILSKLTLILLTWTIWRAPTNASKWRMGFNSAFKGLSISGTVLPVLCVPYTVSVHLLSNLCLYRAVQRLLFKKKPMSNH